MYYAKILNIGCYMHNNIIIMTYRIVKLTSPNLNYFTIAGTMLMYISTYFYLLPETSEPVIVARCIVSWLIQLNLEQYFLINSTHLKLLFPWPLAVGTLALYNWILACIWNYALKDVEGVSDIS